MVLPNASLRYDPARDLTAFALVSAALVAWRWASLARRIRIGESLAAVSAAFECRACVEGPRVLFVGDSVAVGCGATRPEDSIAGLLSLEFPHATIVNRACNGARVGEAIAQLRASGEERFEAILMNVGGNDILKRTRFSALPGRIDELVREARRRSDCVICTTTPNIGLMPMFFAPLSWWLTLRSRQLRDLFAEAAKRHGAHYVNFFHPRATDPFSREARRFYAPDGLHPSTECYRYVYAELRATTPLASVLGPR
jgi:lysophospholipase L1-like esterase